MNNTKTKKLIVNADDFGRHERINTAVIDGYTDGCITSASIMTNCPAFEHAVTVSSRHQGLGIGLHLTLVGEKPLSPIAKIPSLVTEQGIFHKDYTTFIGQFLRGKICLTEIYDELSAQITKAKKAGLNLTHFDSHQHMHVLPGIVDVVFSLAKEHGIAAVRIPTVPLGFTGGYDCSLSQLIGRAGLSSLAIIARYKAKRQGFKIPDHFAGIVAGESVNESCLLEIISALKLGVTEVMIHPGRDDKILAKDCGWSHCFETEFEAVLSNKVDTLLNQNEISLINFRNL